MKGRRTPDPDDQDTSARDPDASSGGTRPTTPQRSSRGWAVPLVAFITLAVLGAGATGGYYLYRTEKERPLAGQDEAAVQAREKLWAACRKPGLRGAWVRNVSADKNQLVIHGYVDDEPQKAALSEEAKTILSQDNALAKKFPEGVAEKHDLQIYPIVSEQLPVLQKHVASGPEGVRGALLRLDGVYFLDHERLVPVGVACVTADRAASQQAIHKWLAGLPVQNSPLGNLPQVHVEAAEFPVLDHPVAGLMKAVAARDDLKGVALGGLRLEPPGVLVQGLLARPGQRDAVVALVRQELAASPLLPKGAGADKAVAVQLGTFDADRWLAVVRGGLAHGEGPLAKRTRPEAARVVYDKDRDAPVIHWEVICLYPGGAALGKQLEQEIARLMATDAALMKELGGVKFELTVANEAVGGADLVNELQRLVDKDRSLRGALVDDLRFDEEGRLVIDVELADGAKEAAVYELARRVPGLKRIMDRAQPAPKKAPDQQEVAAEEEKKAEEGHPTIRRIREALAADPLLAHVRIDGFEWARREPKKDGKQKDDGKQDSPAQLVPRFEGRSLLPRDKDKLGEKLAQVLASVLKEELAKGKKKGKGREITGVDLDDAELFSWPTEPEVHPWQRELNRKGLAGVLLLDAFYLAGGGLHAVALLDTAEQEAKVRAAVAELAGEKTGATLSAVPLRDGKSASWARRLQKALADRKGADADLCRRSWVERVEWDYAQGVPQLQAYGLSLQPLAGKKEEDGQALLTAPLESGLRELIGELKQSLETRATEEKAKQEKDRAAGPAQRVQRAAAPLLALADAKDEKGPRAVRPRFRFLADPVRALSVKAVDDESLAGVAFADHYFDEAGTLQLVGAVCNARQREQVRAAVAKDLQDSWRQATDGKATARPDAAADKMSDKAERNALAQLQKAFAGKFEDTAESKRLRSTRLDRARFRYRKGDKDGPPVLHLEFAGACLTKSEADVEAVKKELQKRVGKLLEAEVGAPLEPAIDVEKIAISKGADPLEALQEAVNKNRETKGVLVEDLRFDERGELQLDLEFTSATKTEAVRKLADALPALRALRKPAADKDREKECAGELYRIAAEDEDDRLAQARRAIQKKLAQHPLLRCVRVEGFGWVAAPERKVIVLGRSLLPLSQVRRPLAAFLDKELVPILEGLAKKPLFRQATAQKVLLSGDEFHAPPRSPLMLLQNKTQDGARGALFTAIGYNDAGDVVLAVRLASDDQKPAVEALVGDTAGLDRDYLPTGKVRLDVSLHRWHPDGIKDWKALVAKLQSLLTGETARQTRLSGAYFAYQEAKDGALSLRLALEGVSIGPADADLLPELTASLKWIEPFLPTDYAGPDARRVARIDLVSLVQARIAAAPPQKGRKETPLDGAGVGQAYFGDGDTVAFRGVCRDAAQRDAVKAVAEAILGETVLAGFAADVTRLQPLRSQEVLHSLRTWAEGQLDEAWLERLYFDADGVLTLRGFVSTQAKDRKPSDQDRVRDRLAEALAADTQFQGRSRVREFIDPKAKDRGKGPNVVLPYREPITARLRQRVQASRDPDAAPPERRWDGLVLRRGYYTAKGEFALAGLCDGARQREALRDDLLGLASEGPFAAAFANGVYVEGLAEAPVGPMLVRLTKWLPSAAAFDGVTIDRAFHDVDNRLVLRLDVVGRGPAAGATTLLRKQLAADRRYRLRVDADWLRVRELDERKDAGGPLRLLVGERRRADGEMGERLVLKAISTLRLGLGTPSAARACCQLAEGRPAEVPAEVKEHLRRQVVAARELLDVALLHVPADATAWNLRALCDLLLDEAVLSERDLRRQIEAEGFGGLGGERVERLRKTESLQGPFRARLAALRARVARDVKAARPPLQLSDVP